jgi:hypothetical protein
MHHPVRYVRRMSAATTAPGPARGLYFAACLCPVLLVPCLTAGVGASVLPHTYHVGIMGIGSSCNFSTIKEAVDASASGDTIVIDGGQSYDGEHLLIDGKSITIKAGPCAPIIGGGSPAAATANPQVTLSGNFGAGSAILTINGAASVNLIDLKLTGNHSSGNGGAIEYIGTGTLTLGNVSVTGNTANNGGGIDFNASNGDATLVLGADTQITGNTATGGDLDARDGGGGIRVAGPTAHLKVHEGGNLIFNNHAAGGYGGGIELLGSEATIDSPGYLGNPLVWSNDAAYGGGIAVVSTDPGDALLNIGARDANYPVRIESNFASHTGGGIFLKPNDSVFSGYDDAAVYANSFRIDGNSAVEGSAIYADSYTNNIDETFGAHVYLNRGVCSGLNCNTIDGNETHDGDNNPTPGSTILLQSSYFTATAVHMRNNTGAHVIRGVDSNSVFLYGSLLAENHLTAELITGNGVYFNIYQCTFANDSIDASQVINTDTDLSLTNSILAEPGTAALLQTGGSQTVQNIVGVDTGGLPASATIVQANPLFFDSGNSDYRLSVRTDGVTSSESPAVDFAAAMNDADNTDIDGRSRDVDVAFLVDRFGPRDLGAYEMQPIPDRLFVNGFGDSYQLVY